MKKEQLILWNIHWSRIRSNSGTINHQSCVRFSDVFLDHTSCWGLCDIYGTWVESCESACDNWGRLEIYIGHHTLDMRTPAFQSYPPLGQYNSNVWVAVEHGSTRSHLQTTQRIHRSLRNAHNFLLIHQWKWDTRLQTFVTKWNIPCHLGNTCPLQYYIYSDF
jgi:hypothetical protein